MTDSEIDRMVKNKYPVTANEKKCRTDKYFRDQMRNEYKAKLIKEKQKLNRVMV